MCVKINLFYVVIDVDDDFRDFQGLARAFQLALATLRTAS